MNEVERIDDAWTFYERSLGTLTSGIDEDAEMPRPSALHLASNIPASGGVESTWNGAGWVEVAYGASGNVTSFTVHGQCHDVSTDSCVDDTSDSVADRITALRTACTCAQDQHYSLRWDELNRLVDARRYDRPGTGTWTGAARMRYRYDGANQRGIKEVITSPMTSGPGGIFGTGGGGSGTGWTTSERISLFVYPGDYERRGLTRTFSTYTADTSGPDATETQYLVAGARLVWANSADGLTPLIDNNRRATINVTDLLGTTGAVVDLLTADVVEVSTYYPNGARENLWTSDSITPLEPMGFTTKEADEEIGMTYFGERWLIPRLGRWATPDPLHIHAAGGGEALNSYHYVSGNLLAAVDPQGLLGFSFASSADPTSGVRDDAALRSTLRNSTWNMVSALRDELSYYFGIRTGVTGEGGNDILDLYTIEDAGVLAAAQTRVEQGMRDRGWDQAAIDAGLADWNTARQFLTSVVQSRRDIQITTRDPESGRTLYGWKATTGDTNGRILHIYANPLTFADNGRIIASSHGAAVAMGSIFAGILHEPGHGDPDTQLLTQTLDGDVPGGCPLRPRCPRTDRVTIENEITLDTDRVLEVLGLPTRGDYFEQSPPWDGRNSSNPANRTVRLENGDTVTFPTTNQLRPDRPPARETP